MAKDYRNELDLHTSRKNVPRPVAIVVLLGVAAALSFTAMEVVKEGKKRHAPKAHAAPAAPGAQ